MTDPLTALPCGLPKYAVEVTRAVTDAETRHFGDTYAPSTVEMLAARAAEVLDPVFDRLRELLGVVVQGDPMSVEAADELRTLLNL